MLLDERANEIQQIIGAVFFGFCSHSDFPACPSGFTEIYHSVKEGTRVCRLLSDGILDCVVVLVL
jgi:hypothetical protein